MFMYTCKIILYTCKLIMYTKSHNISFTQVKIYVVQWKTYAVMSLQGHRNYRYCKINFKDFTIACHGIVLHITALCERYTQVTGGFPYEWSVMRGFDMIYLGHIVEYTNELLPIWDAMTLMWCHCNVLLTRERNMHYVQVYLEGVKWL